MNLNEMAKYYLLNETERKVLNEIMISIREGQEKILIRDIAGRSYVSTTTVVKLAKKLNFKGYSDMIYALRKCITEKERPGEIFGLKNVLNNFDKQKLNELIEDLYLHKKQKIYIIGLGFSGIVAIYFIKRLATFNIFGFDGAPIDTIIENEPSSLMILISKSGETDDLIQIAKRSKQNQHKIYTITGKAKCRLNEHADCFFEIAMEKNLNFYSVPDFFPGRVIFFIEYILSFLMKKFDSNE